MAQWIKAFWNHASLQRRTGNAYTWDFPGVIPRSTAYTISEKAIRFRHPDCDPDRAQKFISLSMFRHLSTRNISSKSPHAFWVILLTDWDRQTRAKTFTSSFVWGNNASACQSDLEQRRNKRYNGYVIESTCEVRTTAVALLGSVSWVALDYRSRCSQLEACGELSLNSVCKLI